MKTPDYLSYDRYKKDKHSNPKWRLHLFLGTFFISLFAFLVIAKIMAPDVDVTIGNEPEYEEKSIGLGVKQFVDERLRSIDLDDLGRNTLHNETVETSEKVDEIQEEKIELPEKSSEKAPVPAVKQEEPPVMPAYEAPRPEKNDVVIPKTTGAPIQTSTTKMVKVYVGRYSSVAQAKVAQEILMDSGLNVSPFVKNLNGTYTLQIGSFAERARAVEVANELSRNGFPARLVQE